jgi:hypothetical protein
MRITGVVAIAVVLAELGGCATERPKPTPLAAMPPAPAAHHMPCPPVPADTREAARRVGLPRDAAGGGAIAGDALISDAAKAKAIGDLIAQYERCRART